MKRLLTGLLLMLVAALPARADLPLLDGNLEVQGYAPEASAEMSAELLLQLPEQIDGWAPVPLHLKVLSTGVESIRLLTDEPEPLELARFELGAGVRPRICRRVTIPVANPEFWYRCVPLNACCRRGAVIGRWRHLPLLSQRRRPLCRPHRRCV